MHAVRKIHGDILTQVFEDKRQRGAWYTSSKTWCQISRHHKAVHKCIQYAQPGLAQPAAASAAGNQILPRRQLYGIPARQVATPLTKSRTNSHFYRPRLLQPFQIVETETLQSKRRRQNERREQRHECESQTPRGQTCYRS